MNRFEVLHSHTIINLIIFKKFADQLDYVKYHIFLQFEDNFTL